MKRSKGLLYFEIVTRIFNIAQHPASGDVDLVARGFLDMYTLRWAAALPSFRVLIQPVFISLQYHTRYFITEKW
jgi:hypothetical protein